MFDSWRGRKFFATEAVSAGDVYAVCAGNGIRDEQLLREIIRDAAQYDNALRRVKKRVRAERNN